MEAKIEIHPGKVAIRATVIKWTGGPRRKMLSASNNNDWFIILHYSKLELLTV